MSAPFATMKPAPGAETIAPELLRDYLAELFDVAANYASAASLAALRGADTTAAAHFEQLVIVGREIRRALALLQKEAR
ncbi:hypothetical protein [Methylocystis parvus]|uniref:hypothetical protein n=1 Tax=Methylocystis parvus TaxID=134 RepID=UPI003C74D2D0